MSALPARPYSFRPRGLYDALLGDGAPDGACSILQNLVHDITTPFIWLGRPAAIPFTNFPSFISPGAISVMLSVGTRIYGMIATGRFPGYDEPFAYNTATGLFDTISGVTSANIPATPTTTGAWVPPTMAAVSTKIIITHPGYDGTGTNFFGVLDIATIAAPTYTTTNTGTQALTAVPTAVASFDNRAWFVIKNVAWYSDALAPTTITNATQFLTLGSSGENIVGFGGLPISQTQGGVLAALIGFKSIGYWQIIPDVTVTYKLNGPFTPGTQAPRSIVQTPLGLFYISEGGVRIIGFDGTPSQTNLPGVRSPFSLCPVPSRICAAYNNTVFRVGLQTIINPLTQQLAFVEYWYDFEINEWSGPHTFSSSIMVPVGDTFACATTRMTGVLYQSNVDVNSSTSVTELGQAMPCNLQSVILAQDDVMAMKTLIESQIDISFGSQSSSLSVQFLDAVNGAVGTATVTAVVGTYWNQFNWNQANWSTAQLGLRTYNIDWTTPVTYKSGALSVVGTVTKDLRIGPARFRVEVDQYQNNPGP